MSFYEPENWIICAASWCKMKFNPDQNPYCPRCGKPYKLD